MSLQRHLTCYLPLLISCLLYSLMQRGGAPRYLSESLHIESAGSSKIIFRRHSVADLCFPGLLLRPPSGLVAGSEGRSPSHQLRSGSIPAGGRPLALRPGHHRRRVDTPALPPATPGDGPPRRRLPLVQSDDRRAVQRACPCPDRSQQISGDGRRCGGQLRWRAAGSDQ